MAVKTCTDSWSGGNSDDWGDGNSDQHSDDWGDGNSDQHSDDWGDGNSDQHSDDWGDGNSDQHSDDDRIWMIMILMMMFLAFCYRTHGNQWGQIFDIWPHRIVLWWS